MSSRVHPNYKTTYRVTNWNKYDHAIVQRGGITVSMNTRFIVSVQMIATD